MLPALLKRTAAARLDQALAEPFEKPSAPSILAMLGVTSKAAVNGAVCAAMDVFFHAVDAVTQPVGAGVGVGVGAGAGAASAVATKAHSCSVPVSENIAWLASVLTLACSVRKA